MLSVTNASGTYQPFMLSVVMLKVIMLNVMAPNIWVWMPYWERDVAILG
jgi:hypothetical protein